MQTYKSDVVCDELLVAVQQLSFWLDGSGAEMAVVPNGGLPNEVRSQPALVKALAEISGLTGLEPLHVMVNRLPPGVEVPKHRDFLKPTPLQPRKFPTIERWHLPVVTNNLCFWWDENQGPVRFPVGFWTGPVPYWTNHSVWNKGVVERIHLVVDLDTPEHIGEYRD